MQRTISLNIQQTKELVDTVRLYNKVVNMHIKKSIELKTNSKKKLHEALYRQIRSKYPTFPSALIQTARDNAIEMLKGNDYNKKTTKKPDTAIRYDLRTFRAMLETNTVSLSTVNGRKKYGVNVPDYFSKYLCGEVKGATVGLGKRSVKLHISVESDSPVKRSNDTVLGIDLGLKNFAVLSNGNIIKPAKRNGIKRRYSHLRKGLNSKGTPSSRRHLVKLGGRERRFTIDFNHCISKHIASLDYGCFALEDLSGIRKCRKGKVFNRKRSNWPVFQFRQYLTYKAENLGKDVVLVNPMYTSQTCSQCGHIAKSNRKKGNFCCRSCGYRNNADYNASVNIFRLGTDLVGQADVNPPIVTVRDDLLQTHAPPLGVAG